MTYAKLLQQAIPTQTVHTTSAARKLSRDFEQHALSHAKRSARASADALCKGNTAEAIFRKA